MNEDMITKLMEKAIAYDAGDARRIQHFIKVHSLAAQIGKMEKIPAEKQEILEMAAILHDIGIHICEEKYGDCSGRLQEQEGPAVADEILKELSVEESRRERICFLIGHHHTYHDIDDVDYQILVEADFLVNLYEDQVEQNGIERAYHTIFRTESGKEICRKMYGILAE